jgi:cytochrome c oxidase subunit II
VLALLLAGCGGNGQSTLNPESSPARKIEHLWWGMLAAAAVVFVGAVLLLLIAWLRRSSEGFPIIGKSDRADTGLVLFFGIAVPVVALIALFWIANIAVVKATDAPQAGQARMNITVIGHQWFWEVRYAGSSAVTANEIHIPVKTPVRVTAKSVDVIHSFWVPELNRKIDMIPGHPNSTLLYADKPGVYRGQCAEFCGLQHAHMAFAVFADPPAKFTAWLANMAKPAPAPRTTDLKRGQQVFETSQCASCHTIRGTAAAGTVGPDLTHLASRTTLAAYTIPNAKDRLGDWVLNPQHVKPGAKMPGFNLSGPDLQALLDYLESLR